MTIPLTLTLSSSPTSTHGLAVQEQPPSGMSLLPPELWLEILSTASKPTLEAATLTCSSFRTLAQPFLFRSFTVYIDEGIPHSSFSNPRRDNTTLKLNTTTTTSSRACLDVLERPHIATAIREFRIIPDNAVYVTSRDRILDSPPTGQSSSDLIDAIFRVVPSLTNVNRIVVHGLTLHYHHFLALTHLPRLYELELSSTRIACDLEEEEEEEDLPSFSTVPLQALSLDLVSFSTPPRSTDPSFLANFLRSKMLSRLFIGAAYSNDLITALTTFSLSCSSSSSSSFPPALTILEIPTSCIDSPDLEAALVACPSIIDIRFYIPIIQENDQQLPIIGTPFHSPDVLPNLVSFSGPMGYYASHFTRGKGIKNLEFTMPYHHHHLRLCPLQFKAVLGSLECVEEIETFKLGLGCCSSVLDVDILSTIFSCCSSCCSSSSPPLPAYFGRLKRLVVSGAKTGMDELDRALRSTFDGYGYGMGRGMGRGKGRGRELECIELEMDTGEPRLTESWRTAVSKMFLTRLLRSFPALRMVRLGYQPQSSVVWTRPGGGGGGGSSVCVQVDERDLAVEKELVVPWRTKAMWDIVRSKQG